jgi:HrpA-like RNA helicase
MQTSLPIWEIHHEILAHLSAGNRLVLVAPTGSGKLMIANWLLSVRWASIRYW